MEIWERHATDTRPERRLPDSAWEVTSWLTLTRWPRGTLVYIGLRKRGSAGDLSSYLCNTNDRLEGECSTNYVVRRAYVGLYA